MQSRKSGFIRSGDFGIRVTQDSQFDTENMCPGEAKIRNPKQPDLPLSGSSEPR